MGPGQLSPAVVSILGLCMAWLYYDSNYVNDSNGENADLCTLDEVGERLQPLQNRLSVGEALFRGAPRVMTANIKEIFANESEGQIPALTMNEMALAREFVLHHVPFVIRNVSAVKELESKWTQVYLSQEVGSATMAVNVYKDKRFQYMHSAFFEKLRTQDPEEVHRIVQSPGYSERVTLNMSWLFDDAAKNQNNSKRMLYAMKAPGEAIRDEELMHRAFDEVMPLVRELKPDKKAIMRIGFHELHYGAHFDYSANFLGQVAGVKKVMLFHPLEEHKFHWERNSDHPYFRHSRVWPRLNLRHDSEFPDFMMANALQVALGPGDMMFIPPLWWHYVEAKLPVVASAATDTTRDAVPFWLSINLWASSSAAGKFMCPQQKAAS